MYVERFEKWIEVYFVYNDNEEEVMVGRLGGDKIELIHYIVLVARGCLTAPCDLGLSQHFLLSFIVNNCYIIKDCIVFYLESYFSFPKRRYALQSAG